MVASSLIFYKDPIWRLLFLKLVLIHGGQGESEERSWSLQLGRWQAYWTRELTQVTYHKTSRSLHQSTKILLVYLGSAGVVSKPHYSLKAVSLKMAPTGGTVGRTYIPRTGGRGEDPLLAQVQLKGHSVVTSSNRDSKGPHSACSP